MNRFGPNITNLCEADLAGAQLVGANLAGADLTGADLRRADLNSTQLRRAHLAGANLAGALLEEANLARANLARANLKGASLGEANLARANLASANLEEAILRGANLEYADLSYARLRDADLAFAEVQGANFDLLLDELPNPNLLSLADGLQFVRFSEFAPMLKLRKEFKDLGLRNQEKQLTCAIWRSELYRTNPQGGFVHSWLDRSLSYLFFDFTCQYGASSVQPARIAACLCIIFSGVYALAQIIPGQHGGIWLVWEKGRIDKTWGIDDPQKLTAGFASDQPRGRLRRWFVSIPMLALYFSLLSALRIGYGGFDFGAWIFVIQPREYSLHATGWVRVISGVQSLISVFLVALTVLTYTGTPFEY